MPKFTSEREVYQNENYESADKDVISLFRYLIELFEIMVKIRNNQGVSVDNLSTPTPPVFVPPFTIFAPWCFR